MNLFSKIKGGYLSFPFFIIVFLGLWSCSSSEDNTLLLLYQTSYTLLDQEKEVEKFSFYIEDFDSLKSSYLSDDLALYKVIKHPDYITYIAIDSRLDKSTPLLLNIDSLPKSFTLEVFNTNANKSLFAIYKINDSLEKLKYTIKTTNRFEEQ